MYIKESRGSVWKLNTELNIFVHIFNELQKLSIETVLKSLPQRFIHHAESKALRKSTKQQKG